MTYPKIRCAGRLLSGLGVCVVLAASGCGKPEPTLTPVSGTVTADGAPMTYGAVTYVPDASKGNTSDRSATGALGEGGAYKLQTGNRDGAGPGWYKVTVTASLPAGPPPANLVSANAKYAELNTTDLSVEVKAGAPAGAYDLKLSK